jgi:NADPH:quinone reductase-like Zn-dependent oxidoreductase
MKAFVRGRYLSPEELELREVDQPGMDDDEVLVRVRATSVNPLDWYAVMGRPYVARVQTGLGSPKQKQLGADFAGTVETAGKDVKHVRSGDEVYGVRTGSFADNVSVGEAVVQKPANLSFEQAAAVPVAGMTALQALRDHGQVEPGQSVLVNGASGGVGTFAVQIASALGAHVTAVCSTPNVDIAASIGAERVIDYTRDDFTRSGDRYDLIVDVNGVRSWSEYRRVLAPEGTFVIVGSSTRNAWIGPLGHVAKIRLASLRASQKVVFFISKPSRADLDFLRELIEAGRVTPVIDRTYGFRELPDALRYLGEGHARGKIVVTV